jgi:hypothetical protein
MAGEAAILDPSLRSRALIGPLDWAGAVRAAQLLGAAVHLVALLLVPRFCTAAILSAHARMAYPLVGRSPSALRMCGGGALKSGGKRPGGPPGAQPAAAAGAAGACVVSGGLRWLAAVGGAGRSAVGRLLWSGLLVAIWPMRVRVLHTVSHCNGVCLIDTLHHSHLTSHTSRTPNSHPRPQVMAECWARCGRAPFLSMAAYSCLLFTGPWHLARLSGDEAGLGLFMPWGVVLRPAGGPWAVYRCADPSLGGVAQVALVALPLTVWLVSVARACVCASLCLSMVGLQFATGACGLVRGTKQTPTAFNQPQPTPTDAHHNRPPRQAHVSNTYAHTDLKPPGAWTKLAHAAALLPSAAAWGRLILRIGSTYGPTAILLSPAMGWLPMLCFAWLQLSWRPAGGQGGGGAAVWQGRPS